MECQTCGARKIAAWETYCPNCGAQLQVDRGYNYRITEDEEVYPEPDMDEELEIQKAEDRYEKYIERMRDHP